jgi:tetratricopeptide (TPR) repeat protein
MFTSNLLDICFKYVIETSKKFNIDESHALKHSMEVYSFAKKIYESELTKNPNINKYESLIYIAAIGHDMCDKKYMDEKVGIDTYKNYLSEYVSNSELDIIGKIISTISYSKVKMNGYPDLGEYQIAYHIVREADLLAAYDIDRCIIYKMYKDNSSYTEALKEAFELFQNRVFRMRQDRLFETTFSKKESLKLHKKAKKDVENVIKILNIQ